MPGLGLTLVAVVAVAAVLRWPRWTIPAFLALTWASLPGRIYGGLPSPVEVGGLILLGLAVWRAVESPRLAGRVAAIGTLIGLAAVATALVAVGGATALPERELTGLAFLAIAALTVRGADQVNRSVIALVAIGTVLGIGAVHSVLVGPTELFPLNDDPAIETAEPARAAGPFGEANFFALSLAVLVPLALYLTTRGGGLRWLGYLGACAMVAGVLATGSRGGLLATVVGVLAFAFAVGGRRAKLAGLGAVFAALAMLPLFASQLGGSADRPVSGRATENRVAVEMFVDHPLTGVGPDRYPINYRDYAREIGNDPRALREAHSFPLELAAEQGIAGIVAWLAAFLALFAWCRDGGLWQSALGRALVVSLLSYAVGSVFLHGSQLRLLFILAGLTMALAAVGQRTAPRPQPSRAPAAVPALANAPHLGR